MDALKFFALTWLAETILGVALIDIHVMRWLFNRGLIGPHAIEHSFGFAKFLERRSDWLVSAAGSRHRDA